jgi:urease accessory protein UreH
VVFDLVVEAADHPIERRQPTLGVDSRAQLVQLEVVAASGFGRDGHSAVSTHWAASWKLLARRKPTVHERIRYKPSRPTRDETPAG